MAAPLSTNARVEIRGRCDCDECCPRICTSSCFGRKRKKHQDNCIHNLSKEAMAALNAAAEIDKQRKKHHIAIPRTNSIDLDRSVEPST